MQSHQPRNILIACGGSGGHLIPGLVVRSELISRNHNVYLSVSNKEVDTSILAKNKLSADLTLKANRAIGATPVRLVRMMQGILVGTIDSRNFIKSKSIDFVLGMGGFNCTSPLIAAGFCGIPRALHESNVIPGKVTKLFGKSLDAVYIGFEECRNHLEQSKNLIVTGTPTRFQKNKVDSKRSPDQYKRLGLDPEKKTVLVLGGSQGSEFINKLIIDSASLLASRRDKLQFIHISGKQEPTHFRHPLQSLGITRKHFEFYNEIDELYCVADVIIARSGSGVISEVMELKKRVIFIPLPTAAENHQWYNAKAVESAGFIEILEQKDATPSKLLEKILNFINQTNLIEVPNNKNKSKRPETLIADSIEKIICDRKR